MNDEEKQTFRVLVQEEIQKLKKDMPRLKEESKPVPPSDALGRLTRMEAIQNKSIT